MHSVSALVLDDIRVDHLDSVRATLSPEFVSAGDRLVRHLFDVGLQLGVLRVVFDCETAPLDAAVITEVISGLVYDLDLILRDAGLAMFALSDERARVAGGGGR